MSSVYEIVTDKIIAELEKGVIPWKKPWAGTPAGAFSYAKRKPYEFINQILLGDDGEYLSLKKINEAGGRLKKGAKSKIVVGWFEPDKKKKNDKDEIDEEEKHQKNKKLALRFYKVFNINDCEGVKSRRKTVDYTNTATFDEQSSEVFNEYLKREGIKFEANLQDEAYYSPTKDLISLPRLDQFAETAEYYSTAFHEAVHSTGHWSRLKRFDKESGVAMFGSESYSKEELVAEIGSASMMHILGKETSGSFENSAAYIQSWLKALNNDKRMIVHAASRAEKAVKLILGNDLETDKE